MDIGTLLKSAPDVLGGLGDLGVPQDKIGDLTGEISNQLGGGDGFDISDLLSSLDADAFLNRINPETLADKVGISPEIAQSAISLVAPKIAEFTSGSSGLGKIAGLAKGFFGGR